VIFICHRSHLGTLPLAAYYRNMGLQYLISTSWPWQCQAPRFMFIIIRSKHPYARMVASAGIFPVKVCKHKCRVNGTCERESQNGVISTPAGRSRSETCEMILTNVHRSIQAVKLIGEHVRHRLGPKKLKRLREELYLERFMLKTTQGVNSGLQI
jgi:hypothetical protein